MSSQLDLEKISAEITSSSAFVMDLLDRATAGEVPSEEETKRAKNHVKFLHKAALLALSFPSLISPFG